MDEATAWGSQRRWAEERRRQEEHAARVREEEARVEELLAEVDAWHQAERIRTYVEDVQRRVSDAHGEDVNEQLYAWVRWALGHADRLAPTVKHEPTVLDEY